jgi:hypothetical protein
MREEVKGSIPRLKPSRDAAHGCSACIHFYILGNPNFLEREGVTKWDTDPQ